MNGKTIMCKFLKMHVNGNKLEIFISDDISKYHDISKYYGCLIENAVITFNENSISIVGTKRGVWYLVRKEMSLEEAIENSIVFNEENVETIKVGWVFFKKEKQFLKKGDYFSADKQNFNLESNLQYIIKGYTEKLVF